ncbi:MAG: ATP-binding protein [Cellulosilyticaceae bacterium]
MLDLSSLSFLEKQENIGFQGSSDMGKTNLATLISIIAVQNRNSPYSVYLGYGSFKRIYIYII